MRVRVIGAGEIGSRVVENALIGGHSVTAIETDVGRRTQLALRWGRQVRLSDRPQATQQFDVSIICVPTFDRAEGLASRQVVEAVHRLGRVVRRGELISIESTVPVGSTAGAIRHALEESSGLRVGEDVFLACSPERIDTVQNDAVRTIPKVVGGVTERCTARAVDVYSRLVSRVVPVSSSAAAEATKLLENGYRFVNIAFINEMSRYFSCIGLDPHEIIESAATKPFGFEAFWPSIAVGGHCVPAAGRALVDALQAAAVPSHVLSAAIVSDGDGVERLAKDLASGSGPILILGLAYKSGSQQVLESAALSLARALRTYGATVVLSGEERPAGDDGRNFIALDSLAGSFSAVVLGSWIPDFMTALTRIDSQRIVRLTGCTAGRGARALRSLELAR